MAITTNDFLARILERKRLELSELRRRSTISEFEKAAQLSPKARSLREALSRGPGPRIIAEFKRASPSKGSIQTAADPKEIVSAYQSSGAIAVSVLTDGPFFGGSLDDLRAARLVCTLPILRKDFVIDPIQIAEARAAGADAILLIVAALSDAQLGELLGVCQEWGMDALVEVHDESEMERALRSGAALLGINNRDLRTFATDVQVTRNLVARLRGGDSSLDCTVVSESGLGRAVVLSELSALGVDGFLIGEAFMRQSNPGGALARLIEEARSG